MIGADRDRYNAQVAYVKPPPQHHAQQYDLCIKSLYCIRDLTCSKPAP